MRNYDTHFTSAQAKQAADDLAAIVKSLSPDPFFEKWHSLSGKEQIEIAERAGLVRHEPLTKSRLSDAPATTERMPSRNDVAMKLEKAVHDGKLEPTVLGSFAARPLQTLASLPHDICKSYGLPILSEPSRFPLQEISLKLEKAIQDGKLPAHFLGSLQRHTAWVLENIPPDVRSEYGIPQTL